MFHLNSSGDDCETLVVWIVHGCLAIDMPLKTFGRARLKRTGKSYASWQRNTCASASAFGHKRLQSDTAEHNTRDRSWHKAPQTIAVSPPNLSLARKERNNYRFRHSASKRPLMVQ